MVPVGSINPGYSGYGQTQSYLLSPPYAPNGERFGVGVLLDPITNGFSSDHTTPSVRLITSLCLA